MSVSDGFKVSEVGVIPVDWDVYYLGDTVEFLDGKRRPVKDSERAKMQGEFPYYGASGIVDYVNNYLCDEDLILLGEDGENILSRNCRLAFRVSGKIWVNNHAHVLRPKKGFDIGYLVEYLESLDYKQYNTGTAQPKLNKQVCSNILVILPPLAEQKAIAQSLSDVDNLITAIDKLITKKRNIKQGTMQELLTGKKRLPGFTGEWEVKTFKDVSFVNQGLQIAIEQRLKQPLPNSKKYITIQFLNNGKDIEYINDYSSSVCCNEDDVLMTRTGNTGIVVSGVSGVFHNNFFKINFDRKILDKNYLIAYLRLDKTQKIILAKAGTSTIPDLNHNDFYSIFIHLPSLTEQKAIAKILTEMDEEIEALEKKREKYKNIKQGMMQQLLTGKTRLKINLEYR
jgi:type I restriction enzyme S subunit